MLATITHAFLGIRFFILIGGSSAESVVPAAILAG
jgi:hypothetical protein